MVQIVAPGRFLDGIVFSIFLLCLSGFSLFIFGNFYHYVVVSEAEKLGIISKIFDRMFPFAKHKYAFDLTHVLLFAILVCLLSMMHHPAQDIIESNNVLKERKDEKKAKAAAEASKEKDKSK